MISLNVAQFTIAIAGFGVFGFACGYVARGRQ